MSLTVLSLNVGRMLQPRTRNYLENLDIDEFLPDVVCLQDIPQRDLSWLCTKWPFISYRSMTNHLINGTRAEVGVAILSKCPMLADACCVTWGDGVLKDLQGVGNDNQRVNSTPENDRIIESTEDRVAIFVTVIKEDRCYNVATTHGFWVRGGVANDRQRESTLRLRNFLNKMAIQKDGLLFAADMNPDRDGEIRKTMVNDVGLDHLRWLMPNRIDTTLDPEHPASKNGVKVVADWLCEWPRHDRHYVVNYVSLIPGVSDHCAVLADVDIDYGL